MPYHVDHRMEHYLRKRKEEEMFRQCRHERSLTDFSSNDYLGFSRSAWIHNRIRQIETEEGEYALGSTGSRLLTGHSTGISILEELLSDYFSAEAALAYNSGYDANTGLVSTVCRKGDLILYDELVHASLLQGIRLSGAEARPFTHNRVQEIEEVTGQGYENIFVITEGIFSMDGDRSPLPEMAYLCKARKWQLIVDEAHAWGIYPSGAAAHFGVGEECFARVFTFSKALGAQGGVVIGSALLKDYLINFSKPFIYSTAATTANIRHVRAALEFMRKTPKPRERLSERVAFFLEEASRTSLVNRVRGEGPVFSVILGGNRATRFAMEGLREAGFDVRAILYPTVPKGKERLRVNIHSFNSPQEISDLIRGLCRLIPSHTKSETV